MNEQRTRSGGVTFPAVAVTLDWLGTATYRLTVDDTVIFLDGYLERVPSAAPVGLTLGEIARADYVLVGHSHFDHLWGVERIAAQTGAQVIGSYETVRMLVEADIPVEQLTWVAGGEPLALGDRVRVRVFPSLHTCLWCLGPSDATTENHGDLGVPQHERDRRLGEMLAPWTDVPEIAEHLFSGPHARGDGGPLIYLIETPDGSVLWQDSAGCWTPLLNELRPDVALLAAVGRPNRDGDPYQGSLAQFVADEVELLRPSQVALCHHDDWMPSVTTPLPVEPFADELGKRDLPTELLDPGYMEGRQLF
jgi:L-ascorbate metabolism protein UlaG (beta-lactamase superfamily)